jgi:hypothetical protein
LLNLIKGSYQDELDCFFKALDHSETFIRKVTKSAFCKARKKLKAEAFSLLNSEAVNYFYKPTFHTPPQVRRANFGVTFFWTPLIECDSRVGHEGTNSHSKPSDQR